MEGAAGLAAPPPPPPPPPQFIQQAAVMMPAQNHSSAPSFKSEKPRELPIYFEELKILMDAVNITDDQIKKDQARRYVQ